MKRDLPLHHVPRPTADPVCDPSEPDVVLPMRNLAGLWQQLFPAERCRLAQLFIERVLIADGGREII